LEERKITKRKIRKRDSSSQKKIRLIGRFNQTGYGIIEKNYLFGLEKLGFNIIPVANSKHFTLEKELNEKEYNKVKKMINRFVKSKSEHKIDIRSGPWKPIENPESYNIIWYVYEGTKTKPKWVKIMNDVDEVWTATNFCRNLMINSGVTVPIYVFKGCINPRLFRPNIEIETLKRKMGHKIDRTMQLAGKTEEIFYFLYIGDCNFKKGLDLYIRAFNEEFNDEDNIKAIAHVMMGGEFTELVRSKEGAWIPNLVVSERLTRTGISHKDLSRLYNSVHCFVLPSRGEGIAMCALEALACEVPVIYTNWGGHLDFLSPEVGYPVKCSLTNRPNSYFASECYFSEPDVSELRRQMRYVYEHYKEAKKKAKKGRKVILKEWTWKCAIQGMAKRLRDIDCSKKKVRVKKKETKKIIKSARLEKKNFSLIYEKCSRNQRSCIHCGTCNYATASRCKKCGRHPKRIRKNEKPLREKKISSKKKPEVKSKIRVNPSKRKDDWITAILEGCNFTNIHKGRRCFVVGNGPSLNKIDMSKLKKEITLGANRCYIGFKKWGFRFNYWSICDRLVAIDTVHEWNEEYFEKKFLPKSMMYLVTNKTNVCPTNYRREGYGKKGFPDLPKFSFNQNVLYAGHTITYPLLQIAAIMGCNPIYLVGVDHNYVVPKDAEKITVKRQFGITNYGYLKSRSGDPNHFDPNYFGKGRKWSFPNLFMSTKAFKAAEIACRKRGIKILNATPNSKLKVFKRVKFDDLFDNH